ncbi:MAG: flavodoxin [Firmicutes bacterium]|nr:flavodoxin [Bacillota bacterium]
MKKLIPLLISVLLVMGLTACGSAKSSDTAEKSVSAEANDAKAQNENEKTAENAPAEAETEPSQADNDVLVIYFSATGTTRGVAEKIAAITDADVYEIKAEQEYTTDDLNYNDPQSRTTLEQNDPLVRPKIGSEDISLDGYSVIYIGYPIWWGEEPRIMDTFVESQSFDGITVIPFCTSSSSGIGRSGKNLADNAGSGNWLNGQRFGAGASQEELEAWINGLQ